MIGGANLTLDISFATHLALCQPGFFQVKPPPKDTEMLQSTSIQHNDLQQC